MINLIINDDRHPSYHLPPWGVFRSFGGFVYVTKPNLMSAANTGVLVPVSANEIAWHFNGKYAADFKQAAQHSVLTSKSFKIDGLEFYLECTPNGYHSASSAGKVVLWLALKNRIDFKAKIGERMTIFSVKCDAINFKATRRSRNLGRGAYSIRSLHEIDSTKFESLNSWSFAVQVTFNDDELYRDDIGQLTSLLSMISKDDNAETVNIDANTTYTPSLGLNTTKYTDDLLVVGYIRLETDKCNLSISSDLLSLFYTWYHSNFGWNPEDGSTGLQIQGNIVKTIQFNESRIYHSLLMSPCISDMGLHQFEFRFKGRLKGKRTELVVGIVDAKYKTPFIGRAGIGDCEHSVCFYINKFNTYTYYVGGALGEKVGGSFEEDTFFIFEVQNGSDNECMMRILHENYENGKLEVIAPIHCHKIGVSFRVNNSMYPIELELVNYNVDIIDIANIYNINEYEFGTFIEKNVNEQIVERLMKNLKSESNEVGVISTKQCINVLLFLCILFVKYKQKIEKRADIRIDKERLKESLMPSYDWILENRLKTNCTLMKSEYKLLGKWLKEFYASKYV